MKSCPTCNRTFEDTFTFCLVDGAILSAPFDPQTTWQIPQARNTDPPPTEVILPQNSPYSRDALPPTIAAPQPEYVQPLSLNDALLYQQPLQSSSGQPASLKVPRSRYVLALVVSMIAGIFAIVLENEFVSRGRHFDPDTMRYVYETNNLPSATVFYLLSYGALAFLFGYKWPQGGWKWGLWLIAIPTILLILPSFGASPVNLERTVYFFKLFLPLLLLAAFLGALLGSKIARHKRAR
jgi:hypothetical protein